MSGSRARRRISIAAVLLLIATLTWQLTKDGPSQADAASGDPIGSFDSLALRPSESLIAPPPDDFGAPADPPAPAPAKLQYRDVVPAGGTWAVVVGINDYPGGRHDLESAVNDANDVVKALQGMGVGSDRILALRDRQANSRTISQSVDWLTAHAGPDAVAVFFYAGHIRKLGSGREAMVGADGSLVSDVELAGRLTNLKASRAWIAMAGCYGGGFTEVVAPGRILTGAAPANKLAYENSMYGRSYMVEYMVTRAMIGGAAPASVQASFSWAVDALSRDHPNRLPVQIDRAGGPLDLRPPATASAQPPRPDSPPAPSGSGEAGSGSGSGGSQPGPPPPPPVTTPPRGSCTVNSLGVRVCS